MATQKTYDDTDQLLLPLDDQDKPTSKWDKAIADGAVSVEEFEEELRKQIDLHYAGK